MKEEMNNTIGSIYRRIIEYVRREVVKTSYRDLANRTGVDKRTLFEISKGTANPKLKTILKIEEYMNK